MNKKMKVAFIATIMIITGLGVYANQEKMAMPDMMLANVEALTRAEDSLCPNGCVDGGGGCTCNGIHVDSWKEYSWGN